MNDLHSSLLLVSQGWQFVHSLRIFSFIISANLFVHMTTCEHRLQRLQDEMQRAKAAFPWHGGEAGLTLDVEFLEALGAESRFVEWWSRGRPLGAQPGAIRRFKNHRSVATHSAWAEKEWSRLEELGKIEFFEEDEVPDELHVNPCALLLKPRHNVDPAAAVTERYKARLLMDLLKGGINERLPQWDVHYGTVDLALSRIRPGDFLFVIDLQDSFLNWLLIDSDRNLLGFYSPIRQRHGRYRYFPYGMSVAPAANDDSLKEVLRLLTLKTGVLLTDFVDDMLGSASTLEDAWRKLELAVRFFTSVGIPVSCKAGGIRAPAQKQLWVGWVFDTVRRVLTITQDKCDDCARRWMDVLQTDDRRELKARQLASAAGLSSHIGEVFLQGRRRLHHIWADLNRANVYQIWSESSGADPLIALSEESRFHAAWWIRALKVPPTRPLHGTNGSLSAWGPKSVDFAQWNDDLAKEGLIQVIETDASKLHGWSYHLCTSGQVVSGTWDGVYHAQEVWAENADFINFKELWVARECLRREGARLHG